MLSPTELMHAYWGCFDNHSVECSHCLMPTKADNNVVQSTTRQVYHLLATAICQHCEPRINQMLRDCLATAPQFNSRAAAASNRGIGSASSEMATITALDLPETLRYFPVGDTEGICSGGTDCERQVASRLQHVYFPRGSAQLLVDCQLENFLSSVIDHTSAQLFVRLFPGNKSTIAISSPELIGISSLQHEHQSWGSTIPATGPVVANATSVAAASAMTAALNTEGSNSYRNSHSQQRQRKRDLQQQLQQRQQQQLQQRQQQQLQQQQHPTQQQLFQSVFSQPEPNQHLCHLHAYGANKQSAGESSCAVCAARHFLQQHLGRISRDPENLAKLERTLRDCMQLQSHWCRSLQWIAANVKESRLPEFVRPLVSTCCSEDGCARSVTVNPQIIITTDGHVSAKCSWDRKSTS